MIEMELYVFSETNRKTNWLQTYSRIKKTSKWISDETERPDGKSDREFVFFFF